MLEDYIYIYIYNFTTLKNYWNVVEETTLIRDLVKRLFIIKL